MTFYRIPKLFWIPLLVGLISTPASATAGSVKLRWQGNSEPDFSHYNVYYGPKSRNYGSPIPVGNLTSHEVGGLKEGVTYYFALTAVDTSGNESGFSDESSVKAVSSEPTTGTYEIVYSPNSTRSNAKSLAGQTVSGDLYIFIQPESDISQVVFSIDGKYHNTENYAPYDLGEPFNTKALSNGKHKISAKILFQDNSQQTISSTVSVSSNKASSIQLPDTGRYGNIQGGDESRINNVKYAFGGMSGDVTLTYRVYDVDTRKEVRIILNGKRIAFAPKTNDLQWGDIQTLTLPDKWVKDADPNTLIFKVRKKKYWWGVGNVSVTAGSTASDSSGVIALPSTPRYGNIHGGDVSHPYRVEYSFAGMKGNATLTYRVYDVDSNGEVEIILNGKRITFAPQTDNYQWSATKTLILPDRSVNDSNPNTLVFNNPVNPPSKTWWGVSHVSVQ